MGIFNKETKKCYTKAGKPECSVVESLRDVQASINNNKSELDRLSASKYHAPRIMLDPESQKSYIWNSGFFDLLANSDCRFESRYIFRNISNSRGCPTLSDTLDAILGLKPEDQMLFIQMYEAIAPTVQEMKSRDTVILDIKSKLSELKDQESKLKAKLGIA